mmetsp:Transcript_71423/g.220818  ORF Transcript_71423/g.220818 Transcript_71423/m.220818 type:complete len:182 (-) Transcript_71423:19-564(-)
MTTRLQCDAGERLLKSFLREFGWGPCCGYYLRYLGNDFRGYIHSNGYTNRNPWQKGHMKTWCGSVLGLEVVGDGLTETVQFSHEHLLQLLLPFCCEKVLNVSLGYLEAADVIRAVAAFSSAEMHRHAFLADLGKNLGKNMRSHTSFWQCEDLIVAVKMLRLMADSDNATRRELVQVILRAV